MDKRILILSGDKNSQKVFLDYVRNNLKIKTWRTVPFYRLSEAAKLVGWKGERDETFYDFLTRFQDLANECFDFKKSFAVEDIERFNQNPDVALLVLQGFDFETAMINEFCKYGVKTLHLISKTPILSDDQNGKFDYILNTKDPNFAEGVKNILDLNN